MSTNRIHNFNFVSLSRPPELPQEQLAVRSRPGVDGIMVQRLGKRSRPFQVTSMADAGTLDQAMFLYRNYVALVGSNPVSVTWAGQQIFGAGVLFYVLAVEPIQIRRIVRGHGGLNGVSYARCECMWTLQPVSV